LIFILKLILFQLYFLFDIFSLFPFLFFDPFFQCEEITKDAADSREGIRETPQKTAKEILIKFFFPDVHSIRNNYDLIK
jgi:hypothetical protein